MFQTSVFVDVVFGRGVVILMDAGKPSGRLRAKEGLVFTDEEIFPPSSSSVGVGTVNGTDEVQMFLVYLYRSQPLGNTGFFAVFGAVEQMVQM